MIILNVTNGPPYSSSFPPRNMNCSILFLAILSTLLVVAAIRECAISSNVGTITEIILWAFLMFYQIFFSPQVKQSAVISNKQGVCEVPHELPNDLRLRMIVALYHALHPHTASRPAHIKMPPPNPMPPVLILIA